MSQEPEGEVKPKLNINIGHDGNRTLLLWGEAVLVSGGKTLIS